MKIFFWIGLFLIALGFNTYTYAQKKGSVTDKRDGEEYKTIKVGVQCWMGENLAYKSASVCMTYTGIKDYTKIRGYLYNWETAQYSCLLDRISRNRKSY